MLGFNWPRKRLGFRVKNLEAMEIADCEAGFLLSQVVGLR
jgi:hypothetical protein